METLNPVSFVQVLNEALDELKDVREDFIYNEAEHSPDGKPLLDSLTSDGLYKVVRLTMLIEQTAVAANLAQLLVETLPLLGLAALVTTLTAGIGLFNSRDVLRRSPLEVLRAEG